eukprot:7532490-Alexandrium_andersonii.AAC.1
MTLSSGQAPPSSSRAASCRSGTSSGTPPGRAAPPSPGARLARAASGTSPRATPSTASPSRRGTA